MKRQTKASVPEVPEPTKPDEADEATSKMMDPDAPETSEVTPYAVNTRVAYTIETLIGEVVDLFPEVTYETTEPDGRAVHKAVTFEANETPEQFPTLLALIKDDPRVQFLVHDEKEQVVYVRTYDNPLLQDSRDTFSLAEAWAELIGEGDL